MKIASFQRAGIALMLISCTLAGGGCGDSDSEEVEDTTGGDANGGTPGPTDDASTGGAMPPVDGGSQNGSDGGLGGGGESTGPGSNGMATSGPTQVNFTMPNTGTPSGNLKLVSGFAYFDPRDGLGRDVGMLKVVLTDWKESSCNPQAIWDLGKDDVTGKNYFYCTRYPANQMGGYVYSPAYVKVGTQNGFDGDGGSWGCELELSSGDDDGGEQVVGKIRVTDGRSGKAMVLHEIPIQVNHCGTIDVDGNI